MTTQPNPPASRTEQAVPSVASGVEGKCCCGATVGICNCRVHAAPSAAIAAREPAAALEGNEEYRAWDEATKLACLPEASEEVSRSGADSTEASIPLWDWFRGVINGLPSTPSDCYELIARHDVLAWIDEAERRDMIAGSQTKDLSLREEYEARGKLINIILGLVDAPDGANVVQAVATALASRETLVTNEKLDALDTFSLGTMAPRGKESVRAYGRAVLALASRSEPPAVDAGEKVTGWTDDQMIRFGNYIRSNSADSHEQRLELFRKHEAQRGIPAPSRPEPPAVDAGEKEGVKDASGYTWLGMRAAGWLWEQEENLGMHRHYASHWSTGPKTAERLYRESDIRTLLASLPEAPPASASPATVAQSVDDVWAEYVAGLVELYVSQNRADEDREKGIANIIKRRMCFMSAQPCASQGCTLRANLIAAANYIDALGGDSKSYRAALSTDKGDGGSEQ